MLPGPTSSRSYADHGSKIFLAPSALDKLTRLHITYPMLFSLVNGAVVDEATALPKTTNAGVLEFTAEEGKVYLPYWVRFLSLSLSLSLSFSRSRPFSASFAAANCYCTNR